LPGPLFICLRVEDTPQVKSANGQIELEVHQCTYADQLPAWVPVDQRNLAAEASCWSTALYSRVGNVQQKQPPQQSPHHQNWMCWPQTKHNEMQ